MASLFKSRTVAYYLAGKKVPKGTPGARKRVIKSRNWYGRYKGPDGKRRTESLCPDKEASKQMLAKLALDARMSRMGLGDPFAKHRRRPLTEHLDEWAATLRAEAVTEKQVAQVTRRARLVIDGCGFRTIGDLDAARVQQFIADMRKERRAIPPLLASKRLYTRNEAAEALGLTPGSVGDAVHRHRLEAVGKGVARRYPRETVEALRERLIGDGRSIQTANFYLAAVKQFCRWLVKNRRANDNPLVHLEGGNVQTDRRHDRRALTLDELQTLLSTTEASAVVFRGLTGVDRCMIYWTAMATGLRAHELGSLTPASFALEESPPVVYVRAGYAKNRQEVTQPIPHDLTEALTDYLTGRPANHLLWPGTWHRDAARAVRLDLEAAGIAYAVDGPSGPLYADFHALRHSFIALLDRAGVSVKQAMQLARHSDPRLTIARYGRAQLNDLAAAVESLPSLNLVRTRFVHFDAVSGRNVTQPDGMAESQKSEKNPGKQAKSRNVS